jgi:hypothetical protein
VPIKNVDSVENSSLYLNVRLTFQLGGEKYECFAKLRRPLKSFTREDVSIFCIGALEDIQVSPEDVETDFLDKAKDIIMYFYFENCLQSEVSEIVADISDRSDLISNPI